jgi:hypothetical protein
MEKMIAVCGLACTDCPAFIATQNDDDAKRRKVAESWSSEKFTLTAEDINCDGCLTKGGRLVAFCNDCEIRACGLERELANCAYCGDYPCVKLNKMFDQTSEARKNLDEIRGDL